MVFTDHQVRQFYVIDSTDTNKDEVILGNKLYFKLTDADGSIVTTDKIDRGCIRSIKISKQPGFIPKVWKVVPTTSTDTDTYVLHMLFRNVFGGGVDDFFIKDPACIVTSSDTVATIVTKLYNAVKLAFKNYGDAISVTDKNLPFYIEDKGANGLYIIEKIPEYNATSTVRGMWQLGLDLTVRCGDKGTTSDPWGDVNGSTKGFSKGIPYTGEFTAYVANAVHAKGALVSYNNNYYEVTADGGLTSSDTATALTTKAKVVFSVVNGPMVAEMEYFFSKGRGDLFGYMGFPDINPTAQRADASKDYWMLDIKYFYDEGGVNSNLSEKELTIACTDKTTLTNLIPSSVGTAISSSTYPVGSVNVTDYTIAFK